MWSINGLVKCCGCTPVSPNDFLGIALAPNLTWNSFKKLKYIYIYCQVLLFCIARCLNWSLFVFLIHYTRHFQQGAHLYSCRPVNYTSMSIDCLAASCQKLDWFLRKDGISAEGQRPTQNVMSMML